MQKDVKWKKWPILLLGIVLIALLLFLAQLSENKHVLSIYLSDFAGAISAIIVSIVTYEEWERRQERRRYRPPEELGLNRIKSEVEQLIYLYAFMLSDSFKAKSKALRLADNTKSTKGSAEKKLKIAKNVAESDIKSSPEFSKLLNESLKHPQLNNLTYKEAFKLIQQISETVRQIDVSVATYGYSFTPEVHKKVLQSRERLDNVTTSKLSVLDIRLNADSGKSGTKISKEDAFSIQEIIKELLAIGGQVEKIKA
jgi:tellurite resistance protein